MQVQFELIHPNAKLPERGHSIDVGLDVFTPEAGVLLPGPNIIPLGFIMHVPVGYNASIYPRTGMVSGRKTLDMTIHGKNAAPLVSAARPSVRVKDVSPRGVSIFATHPPIDPGYTGEVNAIVLNHSDLIIKYDMHTRFGQLVVHPIAYAAPTLSIDKSRGAGAFGSTGIVDRNLGGH